MRGEAYSLRCDRVRQQLFVYVCVCVSLCRRFKCWTSGSRPVKRTVIFTACSLYWNDILYADEPLTNLQNGILYSFKLTITPLWHIIALLLVICDTTHRYRDFFLAKCTLLSDVRNVYACVQGTVMNAPLNISITFYEQVERFLSNLKVLETNCLDKRVYTCILTLNLIFYTFWSYKHLSFLWNIFDNCILGLFSAVCILIYIYYYPDSELQYFQYITCYVWYYIHIYNRIVILYCLQWRQTRLEPEPSYYR